VGPLPRNEATIDRGQDYRWMMPCECNSSNLLRATRNMSHVGSLHVAGTCKVLHCPHRGTCQEVGSDSPSAARGKTLSARHAFNEEVRPSWAPSEPHRPEHFPVHFTLGRFVGPMLVLHQ